MSLPSAAHFRNWGQAMLRNIHVHMGNAHTFQSALTAREQLQYIAHQWKSDAHIFLCGSVVTYGVMEMSSDLDMCLLTKDVETEKRNMSRLCSKFFYHVRDHFPKSVEHRVFDLPDCRVPVVKFTRPHSDEFYAKILSHPLLPHQDRLARSCRLRIREEANVSLTDTNVQKYICQRMKHGVVQSFEISSNAGAHSILFEASTSTAALEILGKLPDGQFLTNKNRDQLEKYLMSEEFMPELHRFSFDCSFMGYSVKNSYLLRSYLMSAPDFVRPAALAVKHFGKATTLGRGSHHLLTSYALNIMFLYFLLTTRTTQWIDPFSIPHPMQLPRYPTYVPLKDDLRDPSPGLCEDVGRILFEFFRFYAEFDIDHEVVSLNRPRRSYRSDLLHWPTASTTGNESTHHHYLFCVEDPYEQVHAEGLNLGRHLTPAKWDQVQREFQVAVEMIQRFENPIDAPDRAAAGDRPYTALQKSKSKMSKKEQLFERLDHSSGSG